MNNPLHRRPLFPRSLISAFAFASGLAMAAQDWEQTLPEKAPATPKVFALAAIGPSIFAGFESGAFMSDAEGKVWFPRMGGLPFPMTPVFSICPQGSAVFAGTFGYGVYRLSDDGSKWSLNGMPHENITALTAFKDRLYAGTCCSGVHFSKDSGATWEHYGSPGGYIHAIAGAGDIVFAGTNSGLYRSIDGGITWKREPEGTGLPENAVTRLASGESGLFAGTPEGLYRSLDKGASWTRLALPEAPVQSLLVRGSTVLAGTEAGFFQSSDNGTSWSPPEAGMAGKSVLCIAANQDYVFAGVSNGGIWRRSAKVVPVGLAPRRPQGAKPDPGDAAEGWSELIDAAGRLKAARPGRIGSLAFMRP